MSDVFCDALVAVAVAWCVTAIISTAAIFVWLPVAIFPALVIAVGSGLISLLALAPGVISANRSISQTGSSDGRDHDDGRRLIGVCFAAMAIRLTCTVALFVACRYQMELPLETIAILVCAWYVLLTAMEILKLARGTSDLNARSESTLG